MRTDRDAWPSCCGADPYLLEVHTCEDPAGCAVTSLIAGPPEHDEARADLARARELLAEARPSKLRDALMAVLLP